MKWPLKGTNHKNHFTNTSKVNLQPFGQFTEKLLRHFNRFGAYDDSVSRLQSYINAKTVMENYEVRNHSEIEVFDGVTDSELIR